ncbi:MAG: TIGR03960 family B12-binding radical SAM protein [Deltaproteobacteria bacterium]|nr:TIGR03960 family B12-binding radical SAM protein [Deltaproteobacteria bacterium]
MGGFVPTPTRPMRAEHPYAEFLHRVAKPVRYLGGEHGAVVKPWDAGLVRVALAFPDLYDIGMSHLGFKILYGILNAHPRLAAERVYAPWEDLEVELRARGLPLVTLESARPLRDFDVVGFSLQFELTFTNVLLMLDLGGIPLRARDRGEADPLVLAGGPTATHPEPMAPFFDAVVIGDGEEVTPALCLAWRSLKDAGVPRDERLRQLSRLEGVYVPALYPTRLDPGSQRVVVERPEDPSVPYPVRRAFIEDINRHPFPHDGPVAATETVFDRISVEVARGCTEGCRFCQAGMIYRPVRERSPESVVETIVRAVKEGGYDEASLTSLSTADYSCIAPLVKAVTARLKDEKVSLSVSSLRAYGLTEDLLDELQTVRATGLTFAPEAGSQRMRDVVNKNVTEAQLMETAERVFTRGYSKMKLYFMIGLPTEEDPDVLGIVETGRKAREVGKRVQKGGAPTVTVSVSTHVPKPHTPFQWCAMDSLAEIRRKQGLLRDAARRAKVDYKCHESQGSTLEALLARGDRRLADALERAYALGARFDSWEERLRWDAWKSALEATGVDVPSHLGTLPVDARLPWDHLDVGLEDGFLVREYRKALQDRLSPPCGKVVGQFVHHTNLEDALADRGKLVCYDCGVACDLTQLRKEREEYLVQLGARERPAPRARPAVVTPEARRPKADFQQGTGHRYRLSFSRVGRAAYGGHLDLVRLLPRILRRAGLGMYYSQGFHPKPELVFGPALALGVSALNEVADVRLVVEPDPETLPSLLQPGAPEGLTFLGARRLGPKEPSVSKVTDTAEYVSALPWSHLEGLGLGTPEAVTHWCEARSREGLSVLRKTEGLGRRIAVGDYLRALSPGEGGEALERAGYGGRLFPVWFQTVLTAQGTVRPSEVVEALFGPETPARFVRVRLGQVREGRWVSPLDVMDGATTPQRVPEPSEEGSDTPSIPHSGTF